MPEAVLPGGPSATSTARCPSPHMTALRPWPSDVLPVGALARRRKHGWLVARRGGGSAHHRPFGACLLSRVPVFQLLLRAVLRSSGWLYLAPAWWHPSRR